MYFFSCQHCFYVRYNGLYWAKQNDYGVSMSCTQERDRLVQCLGRSRSSEPRVREKGLHQSFVSLKAYNLEAKRKLELGEDCQETEQACGLGLAFLVPWSLQPHSVSPCLTCWRCHSPSLPEQRANLAWIVIHSKGNQTFSVYVLGTCWEVCSTCHFAFLQASVYLHVNQEIHESYLS
jgi:hypothetical protein